MLKTNRTLAIYAWQQKQTHGHVTATTNHESTPVDVVIRVSMRRLSMQVT